MMKTLFAIIIFTGACSANPLEIESTVRPHTGHIEPNKPGGHTGPPSEGPIRPPPVKIVSPESSHVPAENEPEEAHEDTPASQDGTKPEETDLKTDATFWWPYYKWYSYWEYPIYRSYWRYPYYKPRYYYW